MEVNCDNSKDELQNYNDKLDSLQKDSSKNVAEINEILKKIENITKTCNNNVSSHKLNIDEAKNINIDDICDMTNMESTVVELTKQMKEYIKSQLNGKYPWDADPKVTRSIYEYITKIYKDNIVVPFCKNLNNDTVLWFYTPDFLKDIVWERYYYMSYVGISKGYGQWLDDKYSFLQSESEKDALLNYIDIEKEIKSNKNFKDVKPIIKNICDSFIDKYYKLYYAHPSENPRGEHKRRLFAYAIKYDIVVNIPPWYDEYVRIHRLATASKLEAICDVTKLEAESKLKIEDIKNFTKDKDKLASYKYIEKIYLNIIKEFCGKLYDPDILISDPTPNLKDLLRLLLNSIPTSSRQFNPLWLREEFDENYKKYKSALNDDLKELDDLNKSQKLTSKYIDDILDKYYKLHMELFALDLYSHPFDNETRQLVNYKLSCNFQQSIAYYENEIDSLKKTNMLTPEYIDDIKSKPKPYWCLNDINNKEYNAFITKLDNYKADIGKAGENMQTANIISNNTKWAAVLISSLFGTISLIVTLSIILIICIITTINKKMNKKNEQL
jgi:hypothetical protein